MNIRIRNQILIWTGIFVLFFNMVNYFQPVLFALVSAVFDTVTFFIVVQITSRFLFPRFYGNQKHYFLYAFLFLLVISMVFFVIEIYFLPNVEDVIHEKPPMPFHLIRIFFGNTFAFFIATAVKLVEHSNRLSENEKLLKEEKLGTELKLLKAQINPHFIFNALNNIYSLTYMQAKNAPDSVLKLSEMLRYVFYECSNDKVALSSEIKYIENFNAFQQMKSDYTQNITLKTDLGEGNTEVAPMLLIPFIENAFKYSRVEELEDAYVNITVSKIDDKLHFGIENSIPTNNMPLSGSGTGLKNVKHRLHIIYPEKHELKIVDKDGIYRVDLSILI